MIQTTKLAHIGIAVRSIAGSIGFFRDVLCLQVLSMEDVPVMKARVAKLSTGNTIIELIEPLPGEQTVAKFLDTRGEGIHHICLEVGDIKAATEELIKKGYHPVYDEPKTGAGGHKVNFLFPKETHGVLIELSEAGRSSE